MTRLFQLACIIALTACMQTPALTDPSAGAVVTTKKPDVVYVPTPPEVVAEMLEVANVTRDDIVYDLGSGDGRIVIEAAKTYGARGVGVDIDPMRIKEANANAQAANVTDKVQFIQGDLFKVDLREATVVTLYLLSRLNLQLRPKLFKELKPGTRVVSHQFDMGDWQPEKTLTVDGHTVYFWRIPEQASAGTAVGKDSHAQAGKSVSQETR